jgi:hypothetical protein
VIKTAYLLGTVIRTAREMEHSLYPLIKLSAVMATVTRQTALESAVTTVLRQTVQATAVTNVKRLADRITVQANVVRYSTRKTALTIPKKPVIISTAMLAVNSPPVTNKPLKGPDRLFKPDNKRIENFECYYLENPYISRDTITIYRNSL